MQLYNPALKCLGLSGREKHTHATDKLFLQVQTSVGGAAVPSAMFPPSAEPGPASDGDTGGGISTPKEDAKPCLGPHGQVLRKGSGPSGRLGWPLRSLSQLSPKDLSPTHGLGNMTSGLVLLADDLAKLQPPLLHLLGQGSHVLSGRRSLFSSRLHLCPRRHRCLQLQLIAERPKVLKLSKRSLERQGRPSRGTPTPPGYGYLTRHLPRKATHDRLSGSASRQASLSAQNEEKTRLHSQMPKCSGLNGHNEQTPILRVPLQTGLWSHSRGYEQPLHQRACRTTNSRWLAGNRCTNSATTTSVSGGKTAAAMASGQALPLKGPCSRPLTGDENQPLKPKSRRSGAQAARMVSSAEATASAEAASPMATTTSAPTTAATCSPTPHQQVAAAPKRTGRSSLQLSPQERERDRPRTRVPPSRRTTCCATPRCSRPPSPGWKTDSCTLSWQQQFTFPRMAGGRLLRRAGGCPFPPNARGRSGSPAHAETGPNSVRPPPQPES
jgi:hypothetical protein